MQTEAINKNAENQKGQRKIADEQQGQRDLLRHAETGIDFEVEENKYICRKAG